MSPIKKILLGILTVAPIPLFGMYIYGFIKFFSFIPEMEHTTGPPPVEFFQHFGLLFLYIGLAGIISLIALIIYIIDIVNNKKFVNENSSMMVVWILIVILLSTIGMIVYYFVEIISRKEGEDYTAIPITDRTN